LFDAGLQEAQRQREHEIGREDLAYERGTKLQESQQNFQAAQAEALQKWQQKQIEQSHAYELQLEKLSAMREMARDKGQNDVVERITNQMIATRKERSKKLRSNCKLRPGRTVIGMFGEIINAGRR
jgi:hypothetical protein